MSSCTRCGEHVRDEARFCPACGHAVAQPASSPKSIKVPAVVDGPGSPSEQQDGRSKAVVAIVGALCGVAVVVGLAFVLLAGPSSDETAGSSGADATDPTVTTVSDPDGPATSTRVTTPPVTVERTRSAVLFSNFARLRSAPDVGSAEITTLTSEGARLEVVGENVDGWYLVRVGGVEGYLFGTFVDPPDPGFQIAQSRSGNAVLLDSSGRPLGIDNESGPKVLVVDSTGSLWEVLLADGSTAFVDAGSVSIVR